MSGAACHDRTSRAERHPPDGPTEDKPLETGGRSRSLLGQNLGSFRNHDFQPPLLVLL